MNRLFNIFFIRGISLSIALLVASAPVEASIFSKLTESRTETKSDAVKNSLNIFADLSKIAVPSVVNITASKSDIQNPLNQRDLFFRRRFDQFYNLPEANRPQSKGTGVIIESSPGKAIVLTNYHVISGSDSLEISFFEDLRQPYSSGKVIGIDQSLDVALLEVKTNGNIPALDLGDSDKIQVGEFVLAIGNPFGQGHTVSHGIISAKHRDSGNILGKYIQTDAPINPGNSGGPLLNLDGKIIGINNAIIAQAQGIGFAIPSNDIKNILKELKEKGSVSRGFLGIQIGELNDQDAASIHIKNIESGMAYVASVEPFSPAARAGLKPYDVILNIDGKAIKSPREVFSEIATRSPGKSTSLVVLRDGKSIDLSVTLGERPS